jgi:hypothetical protein
MKWLLAIALLLSGTFSAQGQESGSIRGIVVNEEGSPVRGATVYPSSTTDHRPMGGRLPPSARTDETGHFVIQGLQFDEYEVTAYNEDQDYPDLYGTWLLFYKRPAKRVKLTSQEPTATVEIRLGPKTGVLVGTITDAITGAPLNACAGFKQISAADFNYAYPVKTNYRLLIPADADLTIKVWLDGYKPWYYPGTDQKFAGTSMRLRSGEEKMLDIQLQPDESVHAAKCGIRILH